MYLWADRKTRHSRPCFTFVHYFDSGYNINTRRLCIESRASHRDNPFRNSGLSPAPFKTLAKDKIWPNIDTFVRFVVHVWKAKLEEWHRRTFLKFLGVLSGVFVLHVALNIWAVPKINKSLPQASKSLSKVLKRDTDIKKVKWIAPSGILGLHPVARIQGVSVGPGDVEKSHATVDTVDLHLNPLKSMFYGRLMLAAKCDGVDVHLKQADNFSWFGFPDDTTPSSRFVPPAEPPAPNKCTKPKNPPPKPRSINTGVSRVTSGCSARDTILSRVVEWHREKSSSLEKSLLSSAAGQDSLDEINSTDMYHRMLLCSFDGKKGSSNTQFFRAQELPVDCNDASLKVQDDDLLGSAEINKKLNSMNIDLENLYTLIPTRKEAVSTTHTPERSGEEIGNELKKKAINLLNGLDIDIPGSRIDEVSGSIKSADSFKQYCAMVEDPGTAKKKSIGSKALQRARNWTPAVTKQKVEHDSEVGNNPKARSFVEQEHRSLKEEAQPVKGSQPIKSKWTAIESIEPSSIYTPAPPEAIAERRYKKSIFKVLLEGISELLVKRISLESCVVQRGTLYGYVYDEPIPRIFRNVIVRSSFSRGFNDMKIDITAEPDRRSLESYRWTMNSPTAPHHLRDFIGSDYYSNLGSTDHMIDDDRSGGKLSVHIEADNVVNNDMASDGPIFPAMKIAICGHNLHAPLIERIVELPMDIKKGRLDGRIVISADDAASWSFPKFNGRVAVKDADFHFWDSSDEIIDSTMDLIFESDRVYLHKAKGYFGAVPLKVTGDLDLNPLHGEYRVSASVQGVEANALRATLGVRPTPFSVSGSVSGTMHVTGPLEKPVFSGHAHILRPTRHMLQNSEPSPALETLLSTSQAVGAYDRVPFQDAGLVFSLDTSTNEMTLHALHADLIDGGQLQGSGKMNVAPSAEFDPSALDIVVRGSDINQEAVTKRFLPDVTLPIELDTGLSSGTFLMKGSHMSPIIDTTFSVSNGASGSVRFQRDSTSLKISSPHFEAMGSLYLRPPSYEAMKKAVTQAQASELAKPKLSGCSMNMNLNGVDIIPLLSDDDSVRNLSKSAGEPVKLRVNGRVKLEGDVTKLPEDFSDGPWLFSGSLDLENIRLNQMKLYRDLKGSVELSEERISAHGKGMRPDETLDVEIDLPVILNRFKYDVEMSEGQKSSKDVEESYLNLRCGRLQASGSVLENGTAMDLRVANIKLDDLELASLRGELQEISCAVNFKTQTGRGRASIVAPKYSGLHGESLSGGFRWEKDVFRLEKFVLQQNQSRYELQGEYVLPSSVKLPSSVSDLLNSRKLDESIENNGRWRLRVDAPYAEIQDLTPVGRLLQSANNQFPADYERAKNAFIRSLTSASLRLNDLNECLDVLMAPSTSKKSSTTEPKHGEKNLQFPALQTCQGYWKGSIQAFGGGDGATSCDFDLRGQSWIWGDASLDSFVAKGSGHSEDGLQLQEFVLNSGDAKLLIRGSLLNENQDATILLTDFPVSTLQPVFRAIPALQHATPAVSAQAPDPIASPLPIGMIASTFGKLTEPGHEIGENSPINGQLFMSGSLRGSKESPSGDVTVRIYDAVVGPTRLANAQASAKINDGKDLTFDVNIVPLDGQRSSGHIVASGKVPLQPVFEGKEESDSLEEDMNISLNVRDGGMAVLTSLSPKIRWKQGMANLTANIAGTIKKPIISGEALISKALLDCPVLKYPLNLVSADVRCEDDIVKVKGVDAYVGRKGRIRVRGTLPLRHDGSQDAIKNSRITLDINSLELKARNLYTGQVDALLTARDSLERPIIGGSMRFSRGSLFLNPQGQDVNSTSENFDDLNPSKDLDAAFATSVSKVFTLLTKGDTGLATQLESAVKNEMEAVEVIMEDTGGSNAILDGLAVQFGPDLRALYPLVMNFSVGGELVVSGPVHPDTVAISGSLKLPSGEINLLAAQFELDREHENLIMFGPMSPSAEPNRPATVGVDPLVDVALNSGDLKVSITGKASEWSEHLIMQSVGRGSSGMDAGEKLDTLEAAKLLESKLKAALLADNGQIALNKLAGSTMATFMPKIETQGSVGDTKWRLVSAPSVPGLLDPRSETSASNVLDFLALGAEVEVTFGQKLQAAMVRKLRESDVMTKWTLNYNLNSKLRMQFDVSSAPPYPKTLTFQYSSEENK